MQSDNNQEMFPIVDEQGTITGAATRGECHSGSKLLHPVVHLHVFNSKGELYLQKRPEWKDIQPGKWDTAVGGHIDLGESVGTAEYMRQMETAPFLKADGLEDGYKVLADFNGIVLAGIQSKYGAQFVTWDWSFDRKGVCHGHYYTGLYSSGNYDAAKRDFAVRSGLIPKQQLFREEQLIEIYRCCTDTLQGGFELSYDQEKTIQEVRKQIEECLPDIMERIQQQDAEPTQEQTM